MSERRRTSKTEADLKSAEHDFFELFEDYVHQKAIQYLSIDSPSQPQSTSDTDDLDELASQASNQADRLFAAMRHSYVDVPDVRAAFLACALERCEHDGCQADRDLNLALLAVAEASLSQIIDARLRDAVTDLIERWKSEAAPETNLLQVTGGLRP